MEAEHNNSYRHIMKYTSIFGSVQGINILAALVRNKIIAYLLGPNGMGLVSLLNTWQGFVCQASNLGVSFGAVPQLSELYEQDDESLLRRRIVVIRTWSLITAVIGFVLCTIATPLVTVLMDSGERYLLYFALIAPSVALVALMGGETAILKATRQLGALAKVQVVAAIASVLVSLPLYYILGIDGIVPVMITMSLVTMIVTVFFSYRKYPLRYSLSREVLAEGSGMIKLGLAFIIAAVVSSLVEFVIRMFLNYQNQMGEVGLYNAAYTLTISYAAMAFAATETDYYPRLSAACHQQQTAQDIVNRQMEVLFLLMAPMLTALMVFLPLLVPMLYTDQFLPIIPIAQIMVIAMFFKALSLPISYMPLAFRESRSYLILEVSYWAYFLLFFYIGYQLWGLRGVGVAWVIAHIVEWLVVWTWARWHYHYHLPGSMVRNIILQLIIAVMVWYVTLYFSGISYWILGCVLVLLSGVVSCWLIYHKQ